MRTTIDLPDPLFREVKSTAAARGLKLKDFIAESLREALEASGETAETFSPAEAHRRRMEKHFRQMSENRVQTGPVGPFNRQELHDRDV